MVIEKSAAPEDCVIIFTQLVEVVEGAGTPDHQAPGSAHTMSHGETNPYGQLQGIPPCLQSVW